MRTTAKRTDPRVDAYIEGFADPVRANLKAMRNTIIDCAPEATETISYGMPAYLLGGKPLVYFAGYARHIGFYATPTGHAQFAERLGVYKQGKGSVQFPLDQPMPLQLIADIVTFRISEVSA